MVIVLTFKILTARDIDMKPSPTISVPKYDCRLTFSLFLNPIVVRCNPMKRHELAVHLLYVNVPDALVC